MSEYGGTDRGIRIDVPRLVASVLTGERAGIARAITLVESTLREHRQAGEELLATLLPDSGKSVRVGISGVPGVGKSTFIDSVGVMLTGTGHKVGVLAVDPSSVRTGGSILGDKTRMARLAAEPNAFIRPSPSAGTLGGVARATRGAIVVLEAGGYDAILVETVGVGQSEVAVAAMVDTFLMLALARAGDQLQGIKRGILELADVIAVNKADGAYRADAEQSASELAGALRILTGSDPERQIPVLTCSAFEERGVDAVWQAVVAHRDKMVDAGMSEDKRRRQSVSWMWATIHDLLISDFHSDPDVMRIRARVEADIASGRITPGHGADQLMRAFRAR